MTTGSKTSNALAGVDFEDHWFYPPPPQTYLVYYQYPCGFRWQKNWSGTDYPSSPPSTVFGQYWKKLDALVDSGPPSKGQKPKVGYRRVWTDHRQPLRSTRADHPYSMYLEMQSDSPFTYQHTRPSPPGPDVDFDAVRSFRFLYGEGYSTDPDSRWYSNDTIALQGKLREAIVGSDFNMGVFLGESKEALNMIANSAISIRKALTSLRRGDLVGVARALGVAPPRGSQTKFKTTSKNVAGKWLEMQYGWMPLLQDAEGAAQALAQQLNNPAVQTYKVRKKKPLKCIPVSSVLGLEGSHWRFIGETRAQLIARLSEVNVAALNGLTDPTSIVWELVPYSFVADWFIPIGSYLSNRGLASAVSGSFVTTTTVREDFWSFNHTYCDPGSVFVMDDYPGSRFFRTSMSRGVGSSLSVPTPSFKPLGKVASWKHCANAVALLTQKFASTSR
jgi:hypothetical protein